MVPLGLDNDKLKFQLEMLEGHFKDLSDIASKAKDIAHGGHLILSAAERLLHLTIEDSLNIGNHIVSGLGLGRADTYKEVFTKLKENKIISNEVGTVLEGFASFRNRLVHLYWRVTPEEMAQKLKEIGVFRKYAEEVIRFAEQKIKGA